MLSRARSDLSYFVEAYLAMLDHEWEKAAAIFEQRGYFYSNLRAHYEYALPYVARVLVKLGEGDRLEAYRAEHLSRQPNLNGYIVHALLAADDGRLDDAVAMLRRASAATRPASTVFGDAYVLVEAAEWLYEDSGYEGFRHLMLELVRSHQRLNPTLGWAYAVEAMYGDVDADRLRALGMVLHLDPMSRRLSGFPEADKERARQWLERNNPFVDRVSVPAVGT